MCDSEMCHDSASGSFFFFFFLVDGIVHSETLGLG